VEKKKTKVGRSGMRNKGTIQENNKTTKRKIKVNVHYRVTKFRHIFYIQGLLKNKVQASLSEKGAEWCTS